MQSFLECRNALQCLNHAKNHHDMYAWLQAIQDLNESLQGSVARKPAIPEIISLIHALQQHLSKLSRQPTHFKQAILDAHNKLGEHEVKLAQSLPELLDAIAQDGVIQSWINSQKKMDWVGHRLFFPQTLAVFWDSLGIQHNIEQNLQDVHDMIRHVDGMLHDFVPWNKTIAQGGCDQIHIASQEEPCGLLIVGLPQHLVQSGITPEFSGNRHTIRIRFQQYRVGKPCQMPEHDIPYQHMLVPIL